MNTEFARCNKRAPGSGCDALEGFQRMHAIFGASPQCIAVHPSDMCIALAALDAVVRVQSASGSRTIPFTDFHRLPGDTPHIDTNLAKDELITSIDRPPSPYAANCRYLKIRDRSSYEFALVSVAAALEVDGGVIRSARIVLGRVAHKPWRAVAADEALVGRQRADEAFASAAGIALEGARPLQGNAFKAPLARRAIVRGLRAASNGGVA